MRFLPLFGISHLALSLVAQTPASTLLSELAGKREKLPGIHQEFDGSQTAKSVGTSQSSKRELVLDMAGRQWREKSVTGSGTRIRIFDGTDLISIEEGSDEYLRTKRRSGDADPLPQPYRAGDPEWSKAIERQRRPCGKLWKDHDCVLVDVPLKQWTHMAAGTAYTKLIEGNARILFDVETGLILSMSTARLLENRSRRWQTDIIYTAKGMTFDAPLTASLFTLPGDDMREVKLLSSWNAARIRKDLVGKPAPELAITDIRGNPITLSAWKGKTVLLDFWTTWCPPCRADGPALEKLYTKYGAKDLLILGISVSEERELVEKFLKEHPHTYPVALTTESEMPRRYQIGVFPTYIVIDKDGMVASAVEGDRGFGDLRKLLKKAGMEID